MKKTLLATAIAGAMGLSAAAAQAATVYDQDGTRLDLGGRIAVGVSNTDGSATKDSGSEFRNIYSRLHLSGSNQISQDLRAFGYVEWRFTGDEQDTDSGFSEVRNSYIGVESQQFGTVMAGNFNSLYNSRVVTAFDYYIDRGAEMTAGDFNARGDSIAYLTPNLEGFQAFVAAKHYSQNDNDALDGSKVRTQGGVSYEVSGLTLTAGWAEPSPVTDIDALVQVDLLDANGDPVPDPVFVEGTEQVQTSNKTRFGGTASYAFNDMVSARIGIDNQRDLDTEVYGLGTTVSLGELTFAADYFRVETPSGERNRNAYAFGAYYQVSSNMDTFVEINEADQRDQDTYVLAGARYFF
ncbi:porin [Halomonas sp. 328]|uniref:porin n=1 Tax=Halomonas sp. 328 TaxID=2776704 RepID=UPI0018A6D945|nr:porin [Halomonas sp. 328]MBF8221362.1 porin [Halomonas sp. 328]